MPNASVTGSLSASLAGWRSCSLVSCHSSWYHQPAFAAEPEDRHRDPAAFHRQPRTAHERLSQHTPGEQLSNAVQVWCQFPSKQEAGQFLLVRFVSCNCCPKNFDAAFQNQVKESYIVYCFKTYHLGFGCALLFWKFRTPSVPHLWKNKLQFIKKRCKKKLLFCFFSLQ